MLAEERHGEETRSRILAVAMELIADKGFAATSTREISERLGFTKAALYYHFHTKDDLLEALVTPITRRLAELVEDVPAAAGSRARRHLLEGYVDIVAGHADVISVLAQDPSARRRPALRAARPLYARLVPLLAGDEAPDASKRARVRSALGGIHAALLGAATDDDPAAVRSAALVAACGALGLPAGRSTPT